MATINIPKITAISISPNPVPINTAYTVSVSVSNETITTTPIDRRSGDYYVGEDDI